MNRLGDNSALSTQISLWKMGVAPSVFGAPWSTTSIAFVMQRLGHLHHILDDSFTSQAVETSSMDETIFKSHLTWCRTLYEMRCEGLFRPWPILLPSVPFTWSYHFELARFDGQRLWDSTRRVKRGEVFFDCRLFNWVYSTRLTVESKCYVRINQ
jgi:hypothetical protein